MDFISDKYNQNKAVLLTLINPPYTGRLSSFDDSSDSRLGVDISYVMNRPFERFSNN